MISNQICRVCATTQNFQGSTYWTISTFLNILHVLYFVTFDMYFYKMNKNVKMIALKVKELVQVKMSLKGPLNRIRIEYLRLS